MTAIRKFRIDDLANPVLTAFQKEVLERTPEVTMTAAAVLDAAQKAASLSDFGAPDFRERLDVWARSADADKGLTRFGRMGIFSEMVRLAANRLQVEDTLKRHPEILDIELQAPLVIAGLPRSGTTFLLQVLAADDRLRSLPYWEATRPVQAPYVVDGIDQRHEICESGWVMRDKLLPYMRALHEMSADHISEDVELHGIDFGSYYLEWLCFAPAWRDYYLAHDHTPQYRYMTKVQKLLSWQQGPARWLHKCPQHMERLLEIDAALPRPTIAILHRDPVASIQSAVTMRAYTSRLSRNGDHRAELLEYWTDRYERLLRACVRDRDALDESRSCDLYFHELMADPMGEIGKIYAKSELEFDDRARALVSAAIANNERGKYGQATYHLREQFGVEPEAIRERFSFYFDRFPVKVEVT